MLGVLERACLASTPGLEPSLPCAAPHCHSHAGAIGGGAEGELTAVLQRLQSPGDATRAAAEGCLTTMVAANLPAAAAALAAEVACPWKPADTRHIAAIILKNLLAGSYHVGQVSLIKSPIILAATCQHPSASDSRDDANTRRPCSRGSCALPYAT